MMKSTTGMQIFTSFGAPVDKDEMRRQRLALYPAARLHPEQEQEQ
jgi:hypothetical protein